MIGPLTAVLYLAAAYGLSEATRLALEARYERQHPGWTDRTRHYDPALERENW